MHCRLYGLYRLYANGSGIEFVKEAHVVDSAIENKIGFFVNGGLSKRLSPATDSAWCSQKVCWASHQADMTFIALRNKAWHWQPLWFWQLLGEATDGQDGVVRSL